MSFPPRATPAGFGSSLLSWLVSPPMLTPLHLSWAATVGSEVSSQLWGDNTLQYLLTLRSEEVAQGHRGTPL